MPQPHEVRTSGGETRMWNGTRWEPVSTDHEPDTYAGGFMKSAGKTIGDTAKGVVEGLNPIDALKGFFGLPGQIVKGYGNIIDLARDPSLLKEIPNAIEQGTASLSDPETGGRAIGNLALSALTGRVGPSVVKTVPRVAEAIGTPTLNIAEHLPVVGNAIKATRTELPAMMDGLKKIAGSASDTSTMAGTGTPTIPRPGRTMNTDRASASSEQPYRMGSGVSGPTNVSDISDTMASRAAKPLSAFEQMAQDGQFGGDRSTGHFEEGAGGMTDYAAGRLGPHPAPPPEAPELTGFEAGHPDIPSQTIGRMPGPLSDSQVPVSQARLAADKLTQEPARPSPMLDFTDHFGPNAKTRAGLPAQADESGRILNDPTMRNSQVIRDGQELGEIPSDYDPDQLNGAIQRGHIPPALVRLAKEGHYYPRVLDQRSRVALDGIKKSMVLDGN